MTSVTIDNLMKLAENVLGKAVLEAPRREQKPAKQTRITPSTGGSAPPVNRIPVPQKTKPAAVETGPESPPKEPPPKPRKNRVRPDKGPVNELASLSFDELDAAATGGNKFAVEELRRRVMKAGRWGGVRPLLRTCLETWVKLAGPQTQASIVVAWEAQLARRIEDLLGPHFTVYYGTNFDAALSVLATNLVVCELRYQALATREGCLIHSQKELSKNLSDAIEGAQRSLIRATEQFEKVKSLRTRR